VDVKSLAIQDGRVSGSLNVLLNTDPWLAPADARTATITLDATLNPDNTVAGTYTAEWGTVWQTSGVVRPR
jgi:hypothetical protein